jgi:hypothetical protein
MLCGLVDRLTAQGTKVILARPTEYVVVVSHLSKLSPNTEISGGPLALVQ